jgi:hypothetical protein
VRNYWKYVLVKQLKQFLFVELTPLTQSHEFKNDMIMLTISSSNIMSFTVLTIKIYNEIETVRIPEKKM